MSIADLLVQERGLFAGVVVLGCTLHVSGTLPVSKRPKKESFDDNFIKKIYTPSQSLTHLNIFHL
jgi:hypothetical protein